MRWWLIVLLLAVLLYLLCSARPEGAVAALDLAGVLGGAKKDDPAAVLAANGYSMEPFAGLM